MPTQPYRLSFTTGGLLRGEAVAVAEVMISAAEPDEIRAVAIERNVVQQRSMSSTERVTREVIQRLQELPLTAVERVAHGPADDARHLMWLAACLRYRFLRNFGSDVLRERLVSGRGPMGHEDFDTFWNLQSSWIDELRDAAESTRRKLRQNTFRMIREAGLLDGASTVVAVRLSPDVIAAIRQTDPEVALSFPIFDAQLPVTIGREGA